MGTVWSTVVSEVFLSDDEQRALAHWCAGIGTDPYGVDHAAYDAEISTQADGIPERLRQVARSFGRGVGASEIIRVRAVPVPESLPPTPAVPYYGMCPRGPTGTEAVLLGIGMHVGKVFSPPQVRGGDRVHNLYPVRDGAETEETSNVLRLDLHTEMAFSPHSPDALFLLCLRAGPTPAPPTQFCDLRAVWPRLDRSDRALLLEPGYCLSVDAGEGPVVCSEPEAMVVEWRGALRFRYASTMIGQTEEHAAALERLRSAIQESSVEISLAAGDMVLVDNTHVLHGRTGQRPRYDGCDRWVQRCYLRHVGSDQSGERFDWPGRPGPRTGTWSGA